jgi:hypothetical protein
MTHMLRVNLSYSLQGVVHGKEENKNSVAKLTI